MQLVDLHPQRNIHMLVETKCVHEKVTSYENTSALLEVCLFLKRLEEANHFFFLKDFSFFISTNSKAQNEYCISVCQMQLVDLHPMQVVFDIFCDSKPCKRLNHYS